LPNSSKESNTYINNIKAKFTNYTIITTKTKSKENISINKLNKIYHNQIENYHKIHKTK
jgi:hypothetical protein